MPKKLEDKDWMNLLNDDEEQEVEVSRSPKQTMLKKPVKQEAINTDDEKVLDIIADIKGLTIRVSTIRGYKTLDLSQLLSIDEDNLTKEYSNQAAMYGYLGTISAFADQQVSILDMKKDRAYSDADAKYRRQLEEEGKKYTEPMIKGLVLTDVEYNNVLSKYNQATYDSGVIKSLVRALEQRSNMLISLGSYLRHEMDMTGMTIRESKFKESVESAKEAIKSRR